MDAATLRSTLLWCAIINYGILWLWFALLRLPHGWLHRLWGKWTGLAPEQFDAINFAGMVFYKVAILLLNVVPFLALLITG
ncbi:MAG: hypothetical protein K2Y37_24775 [Pirellulales bacterium]|nr:hypothetical protein [Pirellulales bacterium]